MQNRFGLAFIVLWIAACSQDAAPTADGASSAQSVPAEHRAAGLVDPARIDAVLGGFIERGELVGVSALVYEDGAEAYFGAFGMADREAGRPMARDTVARIFSMTKPVTGVTLMTFYDDGLLDLDAPLADYLPEYADVMVYAGGNGNDVELEQPVRPISIRDITRHTAGFGDEDASPVGRMLVAADIESIDRSLAEKSVLFAGVPLAYQPGTRWMYGASVDVQARLVEVLAKKPFAEVMRERVLEPLGMDETRYFLPEADRNRLMRLYERQRDGSFRVAPDTYLTRINLGHVPMTPGGYGLTSTLDDYMRFARMLLNEGELDGVRILEPATVRLMATDALPDTVGDRHFLPNKGQVGFGIDFAVRIAPPADQAEGSGAVGEFFWDGLAGTLFWVDPENDLIAVLFNQWVPWGGVTVMKDFRDAIYHDDPVASAMNKAPPGPDSRRLSD